jgi:ribosome modulation factor
MDYEDQSIAYQRGYDAGLRGHSSDDCPYDHNNPLYSEWLEGWGDGMQEFSYYET